MNGIINFLAVFCIVILTSTNANANGTCRLHYIGIEDNTEVDLLSAKNRFKRKDFIVLTNTKPVPGDYVLSLTSSNIVADDQFRPFLCLITLGNECKTTGGHYKHIEEYSLAKVDEDGSLEILEHLNSEVESGISIEEKSKKRASKLAHKLKTCHYY